MVAVRLGLLWVLLGSSLCVGQDGGGVAGLQRRRVRNRASLQEGAGRAGAEGGEEAEAPVGRAGVRARRPGRRQEGRGLGGRRPEGGRQVGRQLPIRGRQRGRGGSRRFAGSRRRPAYDYYDEYYEDYYYDDDYYNDDEYEDKQTAEAVTESSAVSAPARPFANSPVAAQQPDIGDEDYGGLIKKLWIDFLKGKEGSPAAVVKEKTECEPLSDVSYYEPDAEQCDKYYECNIKGEIRDHLCPDGFTFDATLQKCDYPVKVNCTTRPLLQEPQPSKNCTRANGFFPWPASESCQKFWDCREGTAYLQTCPVGVIFDPQLNTCATPDQSSRKECTEGDSSFLGFQCPKYTPESVLKFGNHERLPHPDNCLEYFTCLRTGGPRLATCPRKKVFNPEKGQCGDPKEVEGCENYWIDRVKEEKASGDEYYDYED